MLDIKARRDRRRGDACHHFAGIRPVVRSRSGNGNVVLGPVDEQADPIRTGPRAARFGGLYAFVPGRPDRTIVATPRSAVTIDRNDPALTGGGSLGYNQRVEQGY